MLPAVSKSKISQHVGPSSPPETPRTASPVFGRKSSPRPGKLPQQVPLRPMASPLSTGQTAVNGPSFSHSRAIHPQQLSPRTTSSPSASSASSSDSEDSGGSIAGGPSALPIPDRRPEPAPPSPEARIYRVVTETDLIVEELSDFGDSDDERLGVVRPCAIEYAESDRSRSRSRTRPEVDQKMVYNLGNLNCSDGSDESDLSEHEYEAFLIKRRAEMRRKRMSSGSIGKRTISESIGSDTDLEDIRSFLGIEEAGSSARRLRRRVGDRNRHSLQFQDPPPPRIDELEEPPSSEDEIFIGESLARELPYYEYVSMEVDSP